MILSFLAGGITTCVILLVLHGTTRDDITTTQVLAAVFACAAAYILGKAQ